MLVFAENKRDVDTIHEYLLVKVSVLCCTVRLAVVHHKSYGLLLVSAPFFSVWKGHAATYSSSALSGTVLNCVGSIPSFFLASSFFLLCFFLPFLSFLHSTD